MAARCRRGTAPLEVLEAAGRFPWKDAPGRYRPLVMELVASTRASPE